MKKLLEVKNLTIKNLKNEIVVDDISFDILEGEYFCVSGPVGSGRNFIIEVLLFGRSSGFEIVSGEINLYSGNSFIELFKDGKKRHRAFKFLKKKAAYISRPECVFNPYYSIGSQICEVIRINNHLSRSQSKVAAIVAMQRCGISDAPEWYDFKAGQLKDGILYKSMMAMAVGKGVKLLLADNPLRGSDITIKAQFVDMLCRLRESEGVTMLMAERLDICFEVADRLVFMEKGEIRKEFNKTDFEKIYFDQSNLVDFITKEAASNE